MKTPIIAALAGLAAFAEHVRGPSKFIPARPPAAPLAVRSPYLNTWLNGRTDDGPSGYLAGQWPQFWTQRTQGWQGFIMVDGQAFNWMGNASGASTVTQESLEYTSTRTTFTMNVDDKVAMNITFLSPVYYDDLRRQSITSSYLNVAVKSMDGDSHSVQVYCDVSGEWASADDSAIIQWESRAREGVRYHNFSRQDQQVFDEVDETPSWGNWYWATGDQRGVSYQIGADTKVRDQFLKHGYLTGDIDENFRAISDHWPIFALSRDLGKLRNDWTSTLFTIGYAQEHAVLFQGKEEEPRKVRSLWTEWFAEDGLVTFFYNDYDHAVEYSDRLDEQIADNSTAAGGQDYLTITSLAVRQVFGSLTYTGTQDQVLVFLKEISSNSDIQTVDVLFPALPIMLYLNPDLIRYTLDPLLENARFHYPNDFAQHDLGTYPKALGHPKGDDEPMPLEECGNMVIMMLAYAQRKPDNNYLAENWDLLQNWAEYLIQGAKIPADQLSTDDFAGHLANQTNLAIKGIIALKAMAEIAMLTGHYDKKEEFANTAGQYLKFWSKHGINSKRHTWSAHGLDPESDTEHSMLQYDNPKTYGLLYNIYADKLLRLNFIPQSVYDMQSDFYLSIQEQYGVVLDTRGTLTKVDWEMFAAAVAKPKTRDMLVRKVARWIDETPTWRAFTDLYDTRDGGYSRGIQFAARPVVGAVFALLALDEGFPQRSLLDVVDEAVHGTDGQILLNEMSEAD
ncbi:glutaminase GtaA [Thelonectria olida]|uniref:Glutaminase GtaA n=1 Tax=Thelonectria olida TaxID=1576542 RepID=A0A9P9AKY0_9HYPO|nr:glutaminase GtaA [Thelonectria olida]